MWRGFFYGLFVGARLEDSPSPKSYPQSMTPTNTTPNKKPSRRSIRLKGYDYRHPAGYFVTICVKDALCLFGEILDGQMELSNIGRIIDSEWLIVGESFQYVELDVYCLMPNHFHGILWLTHELPDGENDFDRAKLPSSDQLASPLQKRPGGAKVGSLGAVLGRFKSTTTRRVNRIRGFKGVSLWQRNYWERIIRNERELEAFRKYGNNPLSWKQDKLYFRHGI